MKIPEDGPMLFSVFSTIQLIIQGKKTFSGTFALMLFCSYNQCPSARPTHVPQSWPRARLQVLPNSGSWMFMLKVKPVSVRLPQFKKKKYREHSNIKCVCQCSDRLSATQMADRLLQFHHLGMILLLTLSCFNY